jgi:hypothetical protein
MEKMSRGGGEEEVAAGHLISFFNMKFHCPLCKTFY